jgi:hypothetical protein
MPRNRIARPRIDANSVPAYQPSAPLMPLKE